MTLTVSGCGGNDKTELTIFAAASLTESFTELERAYENDHADVDVIVSFGSSSALAEQVNEGSSPADVIATADEQSITVVTDEGNLDGDPVQFATNTLALVTAADNPAAIACYTKVGFRPVGITRQSERSSDGTWHDGLLMDMLAGELTDG